MPFCPQFTTAGIEENVVFFNVQINERPDGRFIVMYLFIPEAKNLSPAEYTNVKRFLSEANNLWKLSTHSLGEDGTTT
jgi:hypothetical protein